MGIETKGCTGKKELGQAEGITNIMKDDLVCATRVRVNIAA